MSEFSRGLREMVNKTQSKTPRQNLRRSHYWSLSIASLVVMTVSLIGLGLITYHLFTDHYGNMPLQGADYLVLLMAVITTVTAGITALPPMFSLVSQARRSRVTTPDRAGAEKRDDAIPKKDSSVTATPGREIIKLMRSAERLNNVEQELIRKISAFDTDLTTDKLIAEIQICTNRMLKQLEEVSLQDPDPDKNDMSRSSHVRKETTETVQNQM